MQSLPPSQACTVETVSFSAPLRPRFLVGGGVEMYLKSAISRTFCQGYMIIEVRGAKVVIVGVEDSISGGLVVFHGVGAWWCSPVEWPGVAELTRARWLRSSKLDPQSALHCCRSCWTFPVTPTAHSCSCSQCWTDPGSESPHNCYHS